MTEVSEVTTIEQARDPVGWRWTFDGETWAFSALRPGKFRFGQPNVVEPVYSAATIAALEAERDEARRKAECLNELMKIDLAAREGAESALATAERERDEALNARKTDELEAQLHAVRRAEAERGEANWRARAATAESALATANARVERLEMATTILLSEIDAPGGREEILMATSSLRATLTGGADGEA